MSFSRWLPLLSAVAIGAAVGVGVIVYWPEPVVHSAPPEPQPMTGAPTSEAIPQIAFTDITEAAGIDFVHECGAYGEKFLPETMGSGVAIFDYDGDGRLDLFFTNGCSWRDAGLPEDMLASVPEREGPPATQHLYRNRGDGTFEDVSEAAGLAITCYGQGAAVGDFDNDGLPDLYLTCVGENRLLANQGDGTFRLAPHAADVACPEWSSSAAWVDVDLDGNLDLFVCNYVQWSPQIDRNLPHRRGAAPTYSQPTFYEGAHCRLYRNQGDGRFTDITESAGIAVANEQGRAQSKALGVAVCDFDGDGWPDIAVANDTTQNFLFHNLGGGTFEDIGRRSGTGYGPSGQPTGAMGIDVADLDNDGRLAIVIGNFQNEATSLYRQLTPGRDLFDDAAIAEGIGGPTRGVLTFGAFFFDYDLDGRLDLLQANGHIDDTIESAQSGTTYRQPAQLFWNRWTGSSYVEVKPEHAGSDLFRPIVGRGAAYGDLDGDGDLDVVLTSCGERPMVLANGSREDAASVVRIRLIGQRGNRSAYGAQVRAAVGGAVLRRDLRSGSSYLSQSEPVVTVGLGERETIETLEIVWPSQATEPTVLEDVEAGYTYFIDETRGAVARFAIP